MKMTMVSATKLPFVLKAAGLLAAALGILVRENTAAIKIPRLQG
jgi:hypothetical protein